MTKQTKDLKAADSHFEFGENWKSFVATVTSTSIVEAKAGLGRLFPDGELANASFFDIGCGSGLSMLAAKELGAATVRGIDIDPSSVQASRMLLSKYLPDGGWSTDVKSVFDLRPAQDGLHDVVYSWGVLHHTGDMWTAIESAAALVKPSGHLAIALYRKTPLCDLWRLEKRLYSASGKSGQAIIQGVYKTLYRAGLLATGRSPAAYIKSYKSARGMDWHHDVHDWLGGYPYESVTPREVTDRLGKLGFEKLRVFEKPAAAIGFFGSHCDEFVAVRRA